MHTSVSHLSPRSVHTYNRSIQKKGAAEVVFWKDDLQDEDKVREASCFLFFTLYLGHIFSKPNKTKTNFPTASWK